MTTASTGGARGLDADRILSQPLFSSLSRQEAEEVAPGTEG